MIDARATLDPVHGIARASNLSPPGDDNPLWTAAVDIGGPRHAGFSLHLVGACGVSAADALVRGAGEAVERHALRTRGPVAAPGLGITQPAGTKPDAAPDLDAWWPAGVTPIETVAVTDVARGTTVAIPSSLVDDRAGAEGAVDIGPSGAAAGAGFVHAVRSALYEVIERDAVLCAWAAELAPAPLAALPDTHAATPRVRRRLATIRSQAQRLGLHVRLAAIPTCLPARPTILAALQDERGAVVGFGVKLSDDLASSSLGALQEAFQMRALLEHRRRDPISTGPAVVDGDLARASFLVSIEGAAALRAWVQAWEGPGLDVAPNPSVLSLDAAFAHVVADGGRPLVADLSPRLPAALRAMGWSVARVLVPGLQPLRIDERLSHTWLTRRVAGTAARTGLRHDPQLQGSGATPHPLV